MHLLQRTHHPLLHKHKTKQNKISEQLQHLPLQKQQQENNFEKNQNKTYFSL
jgi:hypothetical protein